MSSHSSLDNFETLSQSFLEWLQQNGAVISSKVSLTDLRHINAGRGLLAIADIEEDEELFSIPKSTVLTAETSSIPTDIGQQLQEPWLELILAMIYEYQQGSTSRWKAYFDILPAELDTLMYWSDEELQFLRGSAVVAKIGKAHADETFTTILLPLIRQHPTTFHAENLTDATLLSLCHRMGSTIMAYAFDLDSDANTTQHNEHSKDQQDGWEEDSNNEADSGLAPAKGMVPLADMLNADATRNNARLFHEDDKVVMKAVRPIQTGEEIFNDYGPLPRADVLRRYGYVTDRYARYDVVEIGLDLIKRIVLAGEEQGQTHSIPVRLSEDEIDTRLQYLDEQGILDDGYDIHNPLTTMESDEEEGAEPQFSDELKILVHALTLPSSEFEKLVKKDKLPKPHLTPEALQLLHNVLLKRREMYAAAPTNANGDSASDARHVLRRKMAEQVIAGEQAVLECAIAIVSDLAADVGDKKRKPDEDDSHPRKKQK